MNLNQCIWRLGLGWVFSPHCSKQRSLLVLVRIQKEAFEEQNWIASCGATVADIGHCVTTVLDLSICCVQCRCLELCVVLLFASLWGHKMQCKIFYFLFMAARWKVSYSQCATLCHFMVYHHAKISNVLEIQKYPYQSARGAKARLSPSVAKSYHGLNMPKWFCAHLGAVHFFSHLTVYQ